MRRMHRSSAFCKRICLCVRGDYLPQLCQRFARALSWARAVRTHANEGGRVSLRGTVEGEFCYDEKQAQLMCARQRTICLESSECGPSAEQRSIKPRGEMSGHAECIPELSTHLGRRGSRVRACAIQCNCARAGAIQPAQVCVTGTVACMCACCMLCTPITHQLAA